jgi:capsular polysaccharide biosynthesis protein
MNDDRDDQSKAPALVEPILTELNAINVATASSRFIVCPPYQVECEIQVVSEINHTEIFNQADFNLQCRTNYQAIPS